MRFLRVIVAVPLLLFSLFCAYGFLASFEPGDFLIFRVLYPVLGVASLAGAVWLMLGRRTQRVLSHDVQIQPGDAFMNVSAEWIDERVMIPDLLQAAPQVRPVLDRYGLRGCGGPEGPHGVLGVRESRGLRPPGWAPPALQAEHTTPL